VHTQSQCYEAALRDSDIEVGSETPVSCHVISALSFFPSSESSHIYVNTAYRSLLLLFRVC